MRSLAIKMTTGLAVALAALWLVGYGNALRPFAADHLRDFDFSFLTYPDIKVYRVADPSTGQLSARRIDFFSVADGPTGEEYNEAYVPGWLVSAAATAVLLGGGAWLLFSGRSREE